MGLPLMLAVMEKRAMSLVIDVREDIAFGGTIDLGCSIRLWYFECLMRRCVCDLGC